MLCLYVIICPYNFIFKYCSTYVCVCIYIYSIYIYTYVCVEKYTHTYMYVSRSSLRFGAVAQPPQGNVSSFRMICVDDVFTRFYL